MEAYFLIFFLIFPFIFIFINNHKRQSSYDKGLQGERHILRVLRRFKKQNGKFLSNIYVPKKNGGTTEVDLILIHPKGLFVFESKNYSGWIFGSEKNQNWIQTLPKGPNGDIHKEHFYNPILQNASHIKHLMLIIGRDIPAWSIIVFSDRCKFKNISTYSKNVRVVQLHDTVSVVEKICSETSVFLDEKEINDIYNQLVKYTNINKSDRIRHSKEIQKKNDSKFIIKIYGADLDKVIVNRVWPRPSIH